VVRGYAVQERVGGQSRRSDLDHGYHRQLVVPSRLTLISLPAGGQGRRSPSTGTKVVYSQAGRRPFTEAASFIMMCVGKERKAIHDWIAGTVVLHDPNKVLAR
jgi:hypothetical protein